MPVFQRRCLARLGPEDLHSSYKPDAAIFELALNGRAYKALDSLGIRTIGELLTTPVERLLDQWGFGPTSLDILHAELRRLLLGEGHPSREAVDLSSFKSLVRDLIRKTSDDPRDLDVLEKRLAADDDGIWSLGKLAEKYGLTRERIRQIEATGLENMSLRARREAYEGFWTEVFDLIGEPGQMTELRRLGTEVAERFKWPEPPHPKAFAKVVELRPELRVDRKAGTVVRW